MEKQLKEELMTLAMLTFGAPFGALALFWAWAAIRGRRLYRQAQIVNCPQNGAPAVVKLHVLRAPATSLTGRPDLRLKSCSRRPERHDCGQECLSQIKEAPGTCNMHSILATSYRGAQCAECGVDIGQVGQGETKPVLMSPDRRFRIEWDQVRPQDLPTLLSTYSKICWNCHMEKSFQALRSDRATGNRSPGGARRSAAS
jgi:hypothetical protein